MFRKSQELVIWTKTTGSWGRIGIDLLQGPLFHVQTGMQIHLSGLDLFVAQPERDYRAIYAVVKQIHGRGMTEHMRGHPFAVQRGTVCSRCGHVLRQQVLQPHRH